MQLTQAQRDKIRANFEAQGMPELLAFMAAERADIEAENTNLLNSFCWSETPEGHDFWAAVDDEMSAVNTEWHGLPLYSL